MGCFRLGVNLLFPRPFHAIRQLKSYQSTGPINGVNRKPDHLSYKLYHRTGERVKRTAGPEPLKREYFIPADFIGLLKNSPVMSSNLGRWFLVMFAAWDFIALQRRVSLRESMPETLIRRLNTTCEPRTTKCRKQNEATASKIKICWSRVLLFGKRVYLEKACFVMDCERDHCLRFWKAGQTFRAC